MAETIGEVLVAVRPDLSGFEGEIESGLSNITGQVAITADTTELVAGIAAVTDAAPPVDVAVDANTDAAAAEIGALVDAPEQLELFADTTPAAAEIDALVASVAGDAPTVTVEANTGPAQDEIDALVESNAGDSIDVPVSASGTGDATAGLEQVQGAAEHLHSASEITAGSAAGLTTILGKMGPSGAAAAAGVAAITAGTTDLFHAGLDAISAEERFNRLLGDQADVVKNINVGSLHTDIFKLGEEYGSTNAAVENTTASLFQFAKNAGAGDTEASHFADQIEALSARAISLNPNLGTMSDVADTLATRLARGGRFASNFGLSLTSSEINLRALSDTGKSTASDLTLYEKSAAAAEIATERYGSSLDTVVTAGSKNAQVQVEALSAEFHNAVEEIGKPLVAPVITVLQDAIEPGKQVAAIFGELGQIALPLLDAGLHLAEGPLSLIGAALEIIAPPLQLVADLIDAIPAPVLGAAGAIAGLVFIVAELPGPLELAAAGLGFVTDGAIAAVTALATIEPEVLLIGAVVGALTFAWLDSQKGADKFKQGVADVTQALTDQNGVLDLSIAKVDDYLSKQSEIGKNPDQVKALNDLGLKFSDLDNLAQSGAAGLDSLVAAGLRLGKMRDVTNESSDSLKTFDNVVDVLGRKIQIGDDATRALVVNFKNTADEAESAASASIDLAKAHGTLSQAQIDAAEHAHVLADGTIDYVAAQNDLRPALDAAGKAQADATSQQKAAADASAAAVTEIEKQQKALDDLTASMPGIGLALAGIATNSAPLVANLDDVVTHTDAVQTSFESLAVQITNTKLTQDQVKAIAAGLGVTADQLTTFANTVTTAIDNMTKDASAKLPDVQQTIENIVQFVGKIPDSLDPKVLIGAIQTNIKAIADYQSNIDFLFSSGLPHLTQLALKEGPQVTASLVQGIKDGGPQIGQALDGSLAFADASTANFQAHIKNDIAPQLALQTGLVGKAMTDSFGDTFNIAAPTAEQLQQAQLASEFSGEPLATSLGRIAGKGAVAYQQAIGALPGITQGTVNGVQTTIDGAQGGVQTSGANLGGAAATGFGGPIDGMVQGASQLGFDLQSVIGSNPNLLAVQDSGTSLGLSIDSGLEIGLRAGQIGVNKAMTEMIDAAIEAAKIAAGVKSPSTVFAEIGGHMADGLVVGLDGGHSDVRAAANRLALAASLVVPSPGFGQSPVAVGAVPAGATAAVPSGGTTTKAGDTFVIHTTDPFVAAAEVIRKQRSSGRDSGAGS